MINMLTANKAIWLALSLSSCDHLLYIMLPDPSLHVDGGLGKRLGGVVWIGANLKRIALSCAEYKDQSPSINTSMALKHCVGKTTR